MMSPRQAAFRAAYRAQIAPAYHGLIHVALIYLIGGSALWYAAQHIHAATLAEMAVIPAVVILANMFEWFLHAQVMHRPRPGLMGIYNRHTLAHHQFFTQDAPYHDTTRDYRIVFFPPYALIAFLVMASAGGAILAQPLVRQRRLVRRLHRRRHVHELRILPLVLPRPGRSHHPPRAVRQHHPPPSHRPPQHRDHDEPQHEPDLPVRRLAVRHQRPRTAACSATCSTATTRRFIRQDLPKAPRPAPATHRRWPAE